MPNAVTSPNLPINLIFTLHLYSVTKWSPRRRQHSAKWRLNPPHDWFYASYISKITFFLVFFLFLVGIVRWDFALKNVFALKKFFSWFPKTFLPEKRNFMCFPHPSVLTSAAFKRKEGRSSKIATCGWEFLPQLILPPIPPFFKDIQKKLGKSMMQYFTMFSSFQLWPCPYKYPESWTSQGLPSWIPNCQHQHSEFGNKTVYISNGEINLSALYL